MSVAGGSLDIDLFAVTQKLVVDLDAGFIISAATGGERDYAGSDNISDNTISLFMFVFLSFLLVLLTGYLAPEIRFDADVDADAAKFHGHI
ncbi:MAG: hypothetical protein R3D26_11515 [Cyanobacteriota/Melainabacteria group bacterium]